MTNANAVHAWFSAETALRQGSSVYRQQSGASVNVTRMDANFESKGSFFNDEKYVGEVVTLESGGCVTGNKRVPSINGFAR